jgi:hypothetical protein
MFWDAPNPEPQITEEAFLAALPPRHKDCDCVLCKMDKQVVEAARKTLFGKEVA